MTPQNTQTANNQGKQTTSNKDRFIAFSFASADLFIEVNEKNKISYAIGAAKNMIGVTEDKLVGCDWLFMFSQLDHLILKVLIKKAKPGIRCGPILVTLNDEISDGKQVFLNAIKMPGSERVYLSLGFNNVMMKNAASQNRHKEETNILDKNDFILAAQEAITSAKDMGQDVDVTLFDLQAEREDIDRFGQENWDELREDIVQTLKSKSVDGQLATEIAEGRYSLIHDKMTDSSAIKEQISLLTEKKDPLSQGLNIFAENITPHLAKLDARETSRALVYTINEFERKGADLTVDTLDEGFESFLKANAKRVKEFKSFVERLDFQLFFQPIIDLQTLDVSHYEMLCRFKEGDTMEWIMFGEDIGMAADFDIAVCERAINYINFKGATSRNKFAVNLSGQSMQNIDFFNKLREMLKSKPQLNQKLMFEITESSNIENLDLVNRFVQTLQKDGFKVALDDFGAGASSFNYLQNLHVDYVKIDGKYIRNIMTSQRDMAMIRNLVQMCKDLKIKVIAEFVEEKEQMDTLKAMGVDCGQGYLFGKAESQPKFTLPENLGT